MCLRSNDYNGRIHLHKAKAQDKIAALGLDHSC